MGKGWACAIAGLLKANMCRHRRTWRKQTSEETKNRKLNGLGEATGAPLLLYYMNIQPSAKLKAEMMIYHATQIDSIHRCYANQACTACTSKTP